MVDDWNDMNREKLARRAAELARPLEDEAEPEVTVPLLAFSMMSTSWAVELGRVDAVTRIGDIFPVPLAPPHIPGIIRRRGQTYALVSLRRFFHPHAEGIADADFALIVGVQGKRFALQAEEIEGVIQVGVSGLAPPPDNFDPAQVPYVAGVTTGGLVVLDLDCLIESEGFASRRIAG